LAIVCQDNVCEVEAFQLTLDGQNTPVVVTAPMELDSDGSASADVAIDNYCGRDTGVLTVTATPSSDLVGRVLYEGVRTASCIAPASGFGFVAELISVPSLPATTTPATDGSRSVLSNLRSLEDVTPADVGLASGGAVVLVALITWPTSLVNSAAAVAAERLRRRRIDRRARLGRGAQVSDRERHWWWACGGVFAAGTISVFVDPAAGLDTSTLRMLASMLTAFTIEVFVGWALVVVLMKRWVSNAVPRYTFRPLSLLVVAGAVTLSRLTGFQPGIIFGLVAGISFVALQTRRERATETLVPLGYAFVVSMLAWAAYSILGEQTGGSGLFASEALAAAVAAGLASLPLVLLPVHRLPGRSVFEWSRWAWAGSYALALMGFFVVLMPMPTAWSEVHASLAVWLGGYVAYVVVAGIAWFAIRERELVVEPENAPAELDSQHTK
jgi:hypothetical protein